MTGLEAQVREARSLADRQAGQAEQVARAGKAAEAEIARLTELRDRCAKVGAAFTLIGEEAQDVARAQIEGLATRALQTVFGTHLSFHLVARTRGGATVMDMVVRSAYGGVVTESPVLDSHGGGLAAVVGFVLRLVVLLLTPDLRRLLVLDEAFGHVSESFAPAVAAFLREVADKAGVQILLVTHSKVYGGYADEEVLVSLGDNGVTRVQQAGDGA